MHNNNKTKMTKQKGSNSAEYEDYIKKMAESAPEEGRNYQVALCDLAIKENVIICLPTGCGKTYIALSVAKLEYLPKAIEKNKKIIFLANSIPLVYQQAKYFRKHISSAPYGETSYAEKSHVKEITGDMGTDYWDKSKWTQIMESVEILVMTPEILRIALHHNRVSFDQIILLIIDECHHATKNDPMAVIMRKYRETKKTHPGYELPRVIGLTATIIMGTSNREKIPEEVQAIESLLCGRAVTYPEYTEVLRYSTSASISNMEYSPNPRGTDVLTSTEQKILNLLMENITVIQKTAKGIKDSRKSTVDQLNHASLKNTNQMFNKNKMSADEIVKTLKDVKKIFENKDYIDKVTNLPVVIGLGMYAGRLAARQKRAFLQIMITEDQNLDELRNKAIEVLNLVVAYSDSIQIEFSKSEQIETFVSSKVDLLFRILLNWQKTCGKKESLCGIVFCQERLTAQTLSWLFLDASNNCDKFGFIKPGFVIGSGGSNNDLEEQKIHAAKQEEVIEKFRDKGLNLIFATNVLEEGLDVPACNVVIRFDPIMTYPSFVQSMGRARKKGATFAVLTPSENSEKTKGRIRNFQAFSYSLAAHLIKNERNLLDVINLSDEEENEHLTIDPNNPNSPKIPLSGAVQLIYQYCQYLSTDRIVSLEPSSWWDEVGIVDGKPMYKAYVALPINSVIREVIEGKAKDSKTEAKRSAFLETCRRLYLEGGFDDDLFPLRPSIPDAILTFLDTFEGQKSRHGKKIGTKNCTTWYQKEIPDAIKNSRIRPGDPFNAYWIKMTLIKSTTESAEREILFNFEKYHHALVMLTNIDLSEVPPICLQGRHGVLSCSFVCIQLQRTMTLNDDEIKKIEGFQNFMFSEFLKINHPLMSFSNDKPFLIAGVKQNDKNQWDINWPLFERVNNIDTMLYKKQKNEEERRNIRYSPGELEDAVVVPWYDPKEKLQLMCVCSIKTDLGPSSPMDKNKPNSKSFEQHYSDRYNLKIMNKSEPFVSCAALGSQLNYLTAKRDDISKKERKMCHDSSGVIVLIPEFVNIYPIPATLLVQAQFLPTIIHRIHRLLLSRQIYMDVAQTFLWKATLNWKATEDDSLEFYDREYPSPAKIRKLQLVDPVQNKNRKVGTSSPLPIENQKSEKRGGNNRTTIVHLDYVHPDEITITEINQHRLWKNKAHGDRLDLETLRRTNSANRAKYILPLVDVNQLKFQSLDAITNFDTVAVPSPTTIMEALTLSNANDVLSLENLEVIGDSFLKFCVSTHIFCEFPKFHEGQLTQLRNSLVSNFHLYKYGSERRIGEFLSGGIFLPKSSWLPPGVTVPSVAGSAAAKCDESFDVFLTLPKAEVEKMTEKDLVAHIKENAVDEKLPRAPAHSTYTHTRLGDKSIADSVEALIGTYFMSGGQDGALCFMDWLGLRAPDCNAIPVKYRRREPPKCDNYTTATKKPEQFLPLLGELENLINYKFANKWLVVEAFSHPGYLRNNVTGCYERLEFIGDAVLDFLVTNHIYKSGIRKSPGELTDLRSALVNNITFGSLAVRYKLHNHLLMISKKLQDTIDLFETYQLKNGEAVTGHFTMLNDFESPMASEIEVPKVLGDIFESLAGAVFLDSKMSLDATWRVFYRLMKNEIDEFTKNTPKSPVRELYERFPGLKFKVEEGKQKSEKKETAVKKGITVVSVQVNGKPYFGSGSNKKQAKQAVAKQVLKLIKTTKGVLPG